MKRVALYLRVSTDEQTTANQRQVLEAWAAHRCYTVANVYEDAGISGAKGRDKRPAFDKMLKAAVRGEFDIIAAWSVCRLSRSLPHLVATLSELHAAGVELYLDQQAIDTSTPSGEAMFGMSGVFAQFERRMLQARIHAGLARARKSGTKSGKAIGRPKSCAWSADDVREQLMMGRSVRAVAACTGATHGSVGLIRKALVAEGALA